ncbi:MAG: hypothetical protein A3G44_16410 [Candidatus Rokubacteria bacterium RIFCSPLOWO2_12_FULL_73_47]|nr:MAG: hypothetical protein A3G44_16410 [Candidatus Rokubacteria bacterium RIFCSPLOWO2_12_FULL_73_47]
MTDLRGRVALVTAGSRGLGAEVARQLAARGADVAVTYVQDAAAGRALAAELEAHGRRGLALRADARDFARAQEVVAEVCATLGGLHILVCGAGIARRAPLAEMSEADWDDVVDVSLKGAFNYVRAAAPVFRAQRYGKIVCVGSINGLRGRPGTASYNAAKAGLVGLVKTAAAELGAYDVNVNLVAPGFIETTTQVDTPRATRDLVLSECAIKRLGTPADVAAPIVFLASDAARHVTGQVLRVDAGQYL